LALRWWGRPEGVRVRTMMAAAASYAALFVLLLSQALRGQSLASPDGTGLLSIAIWAAVSLVVLGAIAVRAGQAHSDEGKAA
jgi:hypothetical protein